ncbi:MAG: hypothetical protein ABW007_11375 [Chitinophagaceae bacterium]
MTTRANKANPATDTLDFVEIEFNGITLTVKTKFKIFKFMKLINSDPISALQLALTDESAELVEDIEMDFSDFEVLVNKITDALSGTDLKN